MYLNAVETARAGQGGREGWYGVFTRDYYRYQRVSPCHRIPEVKGTIVTYRRFQSFGRANQSSSATRGFLGRSRDRALLEDTEHRVDFKQVRTVWMPLWGPSSRLCAPELRVQVSRELVRQKPSPPLLSSSQESSFPEITITLALVLRTTCSSSTLHLDASQPCLHTFHDRNKHPTHFT